MRPLRSWLWGGLALVAVVPLGLAALFLAGNPLTWGGRATPPVWGQRRPGPAGVTATADRVAGTRDRLLVALMGVDERSDDAGRSDSLLLASLDLENRSLAILSIPRDTYVDIPGHGYDKINHAFAFGGEALTLETLRQALGLPIEHFVVVNFSGFRDVVDAVGGIEVQVDDLMHYEDPYDDLVIHFEPGRHLLTGRKALEYVRFRADEEGDNGRMRRQQTVLRALATKVLRPQTVWRLPALVSSLSGAVRTNIPTTRLLALAARGRDFAGGEPRLGTTGGEAQEIGGIYYLVPNLVELRRTAYKVLLEADLPEEERDAAAVLQTALERSLHDEQPGALLTTQPAVPRSRRPEPARTEVRESAPAVSAAPASPTAPVTGPAIPLPVIAPLTQTPQASPATTPPAVVQPSSPLSTALPPPIVLVDASGGQLASRYTNLLRQHEFRVLSISRAQQVIQGTVIVDRAGRPDTLQALQRLIPGATVVSEPVGSEPLIIIRLGAGAH